jgi:hypothetical protein
MKKPVRDVGFRGRNNKLANDSSLPTPKAEAQVSESPYSFSPRRGTYNLAQDNVRGGPGPQANARPERAKQLSPGQRPGLAGPPSKPSP